MAQSAAGTLDYRQAAIATNLTLREVSHRTPGKVLDMFACARLHRVKCDILETGRHQVLFGRLIELTAPALTDRLPLRLAPEVSVGMGPWRTRARFTPISLGRVCGWRRT